MDLKETLVIVIGILTFFAMLFFATVYDSTMKEECRVNAIQQNYAAVEILAICK